MTDEETQVKAVELRLDGMPDGVVDFYMRQPSIFIGAYRLWFKDREWKREILRMWNENPRFFK